MVINFKFIIFYITENINGSKSENWIIWEFRNTDQIISSFFDPTQNKSVFFLFPAIRRISSVLTPIKVCIIEQEIQPTLQWKASLNHHNVNSYSEINSFVNFKLRMSPDELSSNKIQKFIVSVQVFKHQTTTLYYLHWPHKKQGLDNCWKNTSSFARVC